MLSLMSAFLRTCFCVRAGESDNPLTTAVDGRYGRKSSIISPAMAANLSLPIEPDFGGLAGWAGWWRTSQYFVDYVKTFFAGGGVFAGAAHRTGLAVAGGRRADGILGMNFFWNRNVIFQPSLAGVRSFTFPIRCRSSPDFDLTCTWIRRTGAFSMSAMGPGGIGIGPECEHTDLDGDGDVDLADFSPAAVFQRTAGWRMRRAGTETDYAYHQGKDTKTGRRRFDCAHGLEAHSTQISDFRFHQSTAMAPRSSLRRLDSP